MTDHPTEERKTKNYDEMLGARSFVQRNLQRTRSAESLAKEVGQ